MDYKGGIIDDIELCAPGYEHAVLIVGYGTDEDTNQEFWLIKNSWGDDWGEDGYIRILISSGKGVCGVNQLPVFALASKPHKA